MHRHLGHQPRLLQQALEAMDTQLQALLQEKLDMRQPVPTLASYTAISNDDNKTPILHKFAWCDDDVATAVTAADVLLLVGYSLNLDALACHGLIRIYVHMESVMR